jgi:hypothetical protein
LDPELRSFLEAMELRTNAKMEAMELRLTNKIDDVDAKAEEARNEAAAARSEAHEEAAATRAALEEAAATRAALEAKIDAAASENRALHEHTWEKIKAMGEGLSTDQREETRRIVADRERALMDQHILPLRASAANHESRLKAVEGR